MIDKDLDSILANIDKELEIEKPHTRAVEENITKNELVASQKTVKERIESFHITPSLRTFEKGLLAKLKIHLDCCESFRATNVNAENDSELEQVLQKYKYTFIRYVENIEKLCNDYFITLDLRTLEKKAKKEYNRIFEGYEEQNKLNFLILVEMFVELREFNSLVKKEWRELAKSIGVINLVSGGKNLFQSLNAIVEQALILCNETSEFLLFLSHLIGIPENRQDLLKSEIYKQCTYYDDITYAYESIFDIGKAKSNEMNVDSMLDIQREIKAEQKIEENISQLQSQSITEIIETEEKKGEEDLSEKESIPFTIKGTRPWNTKEPYIIRINAKRLQKEKEDLLESFYFIQTPIEEKILEGEIKRNLLAFLRNRSLNIAESYAEFLFKTISMKMQEISAFFNVEKNVNIFLYHMGPFTAYQIIYDCFISEGFGYCFKYAAGNKVVKFIPTEFIKATVLEWFEHNVNVFELPFDSIQEYENVRKLVSKKYFAAVDENYKKMDELYAKNVLAKNIKIDKQAFFKNHWKEWFGASNIFVYNRFLEKTIFKQSE